MEIICHFQLDFASIESQFDIKFKQYFATELQTLNVLVQDGLITLDDKGITVTAIGRLLIRNICMVFDAYLGGIQINNTSQAI